MQTTTDRVPNRLVNEKSPYLLQHAYNPVDWFPWCEEAFKKAKQEDKPIFLSIGYSWRGCSYPLAIGGKNVTRTKRNIL